MFIPPQVSQRLGGFNAGSAPVSGGRVKGSAQPMPPPQMSAGGTLSPVSGGRVKGSAQPMPPPQMSAGDTLSPVSVTGPQMHIRHNGYPPPQADPRMAMLASLRR